MIQAPYLDPKKIPKTAEKFLPLPGDENKNPISDAAQTAFMRALKKYKEEVGKS